MAATGSRATCSAGLGLPRRWKAPWPAPRSECALNLQPSSLTQGLSQSLAPLREYREKMDTVITELSSRITQEQLASTLRYTNTAGQQQAKSLGPLVQHLFNHQTHHRGQATTMLFQAGVDVGVTDLVAIIPSEV
ncbi:MAG: hypothetical protein EOO27_45810 [Comamonadaceae bacterium]|nr:MAG: hypothetical protein EOO27_45810 [Comamonadaceae bacterium]